MTDDNEEAVAVDKEELEDVYVGKNLVTKKEETDMTSPTGNDVMRVHFQDKNEAPELMTQKVFEAVSSEEEKDATFVRNQRFRAVTKAITDLITEWNIKYGDITGLFQKLGEQLDNRYQRALNYLWKGNDDYWTAGVSPSEDVQTMEIQSVLDDLEDNDESDE